MPKGWEMWADVDSRPILQDCSETLEAADCAAPLAVALGNPALYYKCTTKRMCSALHALLSVHRQTLQGLAELDGQFTNQWMGANVGNTTSASLGIASAVCLFVVQPLGIGLGVGSALCAGVTFAGDTIADHAHHSILRKQLSRDAMNAFVVAGLIQEWVQAQQSLGSSGEQLSFTVGRVATPARCSTSGDAIDGGLAAGSVVNGVASRVGAGVAGASQVLGIAGALIQTGVAIRGWTSTNAGQQIVRSKVQELSYRILQIQHLLAAMDRLECTACSDMVTLADDVRHCKQNLHCFHARCVSHFSPSRKLCCPSCGSAFTKDFEMLVESASRYKQNTLAAARKKQSVLEGALGSCCNVQRAIPDRM